MKRLLVMLAIPLLLAAGGDKATKQAGQIPAMGGAAHVFVTPGEVKWGGAPEGLPAGAKAVVLEGDPSKEGFFAIRAQFPAGYKIAPHRHPTQERVTVISGTLLLGSGDKWDDSALKKYPAGSYLSMPAGMTHFAQAGEDTVVQIATVGPWGITYVNQADDPRNQKGKM